MRTRWRRVGIMGRGEAWKTQIRRLGEVKFEGGEGGEKELRKEERWGEG